jgi:hypothetical protein
MLSPLAVAQVQLEFAPPLSGPYTYVFAARPYSTLVSHMVH